VDEPLLRRIDTYLDAVPRPASRVESLGPFTLFVTEGPGAPYYARPTPGAATFTADDVRAVRARQRELGMPEAFEWVVELAPGVETAARAAGLEVVRHPLLHLPVPRFRPIDPPAGVQVELVSPDDDLAAIHAVATVAFSNPGTGVSPASHDEAARAAAALPPVALEAARDRMRRGLTVTAVALDGDRPVAVGSHQPVGDTTEIVGVGTLPAFRRRGLGAAVTSLLVWDALTNGTRTVFLSAGDEDIARVYVRLGFRRVGTAGAAEPTRP